MNEESLFGTIKSLEGVCTSILQTKRNISQDILIGKLTFAGTTVGVSALVSAIGTASTGTAITTLSGAAATNATLAWIGGSVLVGGTVLTGGAIAVALSAVYFWNGKERKYDVLEQFEKEIISASIKLIKTLQEEQIKQSSIKASINDFQLLYNSILYKLLINIYKYSNEISSNLNPRYKLKFENSRISLMRVIEQIGTDLFSKNNS
jgi:hypothetical protein